MKLKGIKAITVLAVLVMAVSSVAVFSPLEKNEATEGYEASIGTVEYETLGEALSAVEDGQTVTVEKDITVGATISIEGSKSFTLDFNGKVLTSTNLGNYNMIQIGGFGSGPTYAGDFILKNCEFSASSSGVEVNCIQIEFSESVSIKDCTFKYFPGLNREIRAVGQSDTAQLTVENCVFDSVMGAENDIVKISGQYSEFNFTNNTSIGAPEGSQFCIKSYGGSYSNEFGYTIAVPEAQIDDGYYATLADALAFSSSEDTVSVISDVTSTIDITVAEGVELQVVTGKTLTLDGTGKDPAISMNLANGASFTGAFGYVHGAESNFATFMNLRAGMEGLSISLGSISISGTINASDTVTIDSNGDVKLNDVTVEGTAGSLTITKTRSGSSVAIGSLTVAAGASLIIKESAVLDIDGEIVVAKGAGLTISAGAGLTINEGATLNNSGTVAIESAGSINDNGTIVNGMSAMIENAGTISSTSNDGVIVNSGTIVNTGGGTVSQSVITNTLINQVRFNIEQFVYSDSKSGVDITVLPDISLAGASVKEPVNACVKYIVAKESKYGTYVNEVTVTVDPDEIVYENGCACFEVDLKTGNQDFTKITAVWVEYTFQSAEDKQTIAISDMFRFNPGREYITPSS